MHKNSNMCIMEIGRITVIGFLWCCRFLKKNSKKRRCKTMSCSCDDYYYYYKVLTTRSADWQTHSILVINVLQSAWSWSVNSALCMIFQTHLTFTKQMFSRMFTLMFTSNKKWNIARIFICRWTIPYKVERIAWSFSQIQSQIRQLQ